MRIVVAVVLVLAAATVADAEPGRVAIAEAPGLTPLVDDPSQLVVEAPTAIDRAAEADAAYDRGFMASTGLALRQGQFDVSLRSAYRNGALVSVAAGLGHNVELSIDGAKMGGIGKTLGVGMKLGLRRHATWAIAATASVHSLYEVNSDQANRLFQIGMRMTTCTGSACTAQFTFGGGFAATSTPYSDLTNSIAPEVDAGFIIGTGWCRPLMELTILDGEMAFLGLRFGYRHVAFDLGVGTIQGNSQFRNSDVLAMAGLAIRP